jgi:hypothetical protein
MEVRGEVDFFGTRWMRDVGEGLRVKIWRSALVQR